MEENFVKFTNTLAEVSRNVYLKRVTEYKEYCAERELETNAITSLDHFLEYLHSEEVDLAASTLWTVASMCGTWFESVHGIKIYAACPLLKKKLKNWSKDEAQTKSAIFTKAEVSQFLTQAPNDDHTLWQKVAMILAINGFTRKAELLSIEFESLKFSADGTALMVTVNRLKQSGPPEPSTFAITEQYCVNIVRRYLDCFDQNARKGRLFRYTIGGKGTMKVIGINTVAKVPKSIAEYLKKDNANKYTSHCFRRTAATLLAESGASLPIMKIAGGWKSSTVAEGYIQKSDHTKRKIADRMGLIDGDETAEHEIDENEQPSKRSHNAQSSSSSSAQGVTVVNHGAQCNFNFNFVNNEAHAVSSEATRSPLIIRIPKH